MIMRSVAPNNMEAVSRRRFHVSAVVVALAAAVGGCGGGTSSSSTTQATTAARSSAPSASASTGAGSSVTTGAVRATLSGANHAPKVGSSWRYVLHVTDAAGRPLSGTVDVEFAFGGQVVGHDTPPVHVLRHGVLRETLTFPAQAVGYPLALQAVAHTKAGSVTLDWPVTVGR